MLDFSPEKMLFIFLIVAVVLGPEKLPELSRKIGRAMGELRKLSGGFREEMNKAVRDMSSDSPGGTGSGSSGGAPPSGGTTGSGGGEITAGTSAPGPSGESSDS